MAERSAMPGPDPPPPARAPLGGGAFITLGLLGGAIVGLFAGQPTIGLLAGGATGLATAVGLAWRERGRGRP